MKNRAFSQIVGKDIDFRLRMSLISKYSKLFQEKATLAFSLKIVFCMKIKLKSYCIMNFLMFEINVYAWLYRQRKHFFQMFVL